MSRVVTPPLKTTAFVNSLVPPTNKLLPTLKLLPIDVKVLSRVVTPPLKTTAFVNSLVPLTSKLLPTLRLLPTIIYPSIIAFLSTFRLVVLCIDPIISKLYKGFTRPIPTRSYV